MANKPENRFKNAVTIEDFEVQAKSSGLYDSFTPEQLAVAQRNPSAGMEILGYKQDYIAAPKGEEGDFARALAHAGAEQVLKDNSLEKIQVPTYSGVISSKHAFKNGADSGSKNDLYENYEEAISKARAKAQEDVIGQMASLTGGYGSSSAATKAAAAGADYNALLAEKALELDNEEYNRKFSEAQLAASLGDYSKLKALGIDTSAAEAESEATKRTNAFSEACQLASIGDFSALKALGVDTTRLEAQWDSDSSNSVLSDALQLASIGIYDELEKLGYDVSSLRQKKESDDILSEDEDIGDDDPAGVSEYDTVKNEIADMLSTAKTPIKKALAQTKAYTKLLRDVAAGRITDVEMADIMAELGISRIEVENSEEE